MTWCFLPMLRIHRLGRRHKMWLRCGPQMAPHHNKLWSLRRGVVLHHCSYELVNDLATRSGDNTLTCRDRPSWARMAGTRPTAGAVYGGQRDTQVQSPSAPVRTMRGLSQLPAASTASSMRRATSGTSATLRTLPCGTEGDNRVNWRMIRGKSCGYRCGNSFGSCGAGDRPRRVPGSRAMNTPTPPPSPPRPALRRVHPGPAIDVTVRDAYERPARGHPTARGWCCAW